MLWIDTTLAANPDGVCVKRSAGAGSDWNISALPSGNSTPALTRATRRGALTLRQRVSAARSNLKAIARPAFREPALLSFSSEPQLPYTLLQE